MKWLTKRRQNGKRPWAFWLLAALTMLLLLGLVERQSAPPELSAGEETALPGYLAGRVLLESGGAAEGAELFFKVQKAFGASCYSRECESFQKAVFWEQATIPADGAFEISIPQQYLNSAQAPSAYVYTVIVRTEEGKYRPFYMFKLSREDRVDNDFILKPPFMDTPPGGEEEI